MIGGRIEAEPSVSPMKACLEDRSMEHITPPVSVVRRTVLAAFGELGAGDGDCTESILIKDRHFVGRRFCLGGFEAIWMAGESHISIFNEAGDLIDTRPVEDADMPLKKAA